MDLYTLVTVRGPGLTLFYFHVCRRYVIYTIQTFLLSFPEYTLLLPCAIQDKLDIIGER